MNIHLGVNTLNQFHSYSTPYPTDTPMVRPYEYKAAVANPVYGNQNTPIMVTAQVMPQEEEEPRHAQVSHH